MLRKLRKFFSLLKEQGLRSGSKEAFRRIGRRISLNYRINPASFASRSTPALFGLVLWDATLLKLDALLKHFANFAIGRSLRTLPPLAELALYRIDLSKVGPDSIVYSFGVSGNIAFDQKLAEASGARVFLFDPTPPALTFVASHPLPPLLHFEPLGVWTESARVKFYIDRHGSGAQNLSILNIFHTDSYVEGECATLEDILARHGHSHIDVLKMDIEGAALPVLERLVRTSTRPRQIIGELEMPKLIYGGTVKEIFQFLKRKSRLLRDLEKIGYRIGTYGKAEFIAIYTEPV